MGRKKALTDKRLHQRHLDMMRRRQDPSRNNNISASERLLVVQEDLRISQDNEAMAQKIIQDLNKELSEYREKLKIFRRYVEPALGVPPGSDDAVVREAILKRNRLLRRALAYTICEDGSKEHICDRSRISAEIIGVIGKEESWHAVNVKPFNIASVSFTLSAVPPSPTTPPQIQSMTKAYALTPQAAAANSTSSVVSRGATAPSKKSVENP